MAGDRPSTDLVGVVVGAVLLFGAVSLVPIVIMRHRRRTAAAEARRGHELHPETTNGTERQVTVERWLEEQTRSGHGGPYVQEPW